MIQYSLMLEYVRFVHVQDASNNLEKLAHFVSTRKSYHRSGGDLLSLNY